MDQLGKHQGGYRGEADSTPSRKHAQSETDYRCAHAGEGLESMEVSGAGIVAMGNLASRVAAQGGAVLAIDYGQAGPYPSSLQVAPWCGILSALGHA